MGLCKWSQITDAFIRDILKHKHIISEEIYDVQINSSDKWVIQLICHLSIGGHLDHQSVHDDWCLKVNGSLHITAFKIITSECEVSVLVHVMELSKICHLIIGAIHFDLYSVHFAHQIVILLSYGNNHK